MSEERKFIHDLATPLSTLSLLLDQVVDLSEGQSDIKAAAVSCKETVQQIVELLRARREKIIAEVEKADQGR